jgi:DNA-binding transcriptional LysR family regulator
LDLATSIRPALNQLRTALQPRPATAVSAEVAGMVVLGLDDYLQAFLLPRLAQRLERRAPGITLDVRSSGARRRASPLLREGRLDLAVDVNELEERRDFEFATLFEDRYVCLARKGLAGGATRLSSELFSVLNHVMPSSADPERQAIERRVLAADLRRHVSVRLPGHLAAPWLVAVSDSIALVPARLATWFADTLPLDVLEPPIPLPVAHVIVRWHRRSEQSHPVMHVRDELIQLGRELGEA